MLRPRIGQQPAKLACESIADDLATHRRRSQPLRDAAGRLRSNVRNWPEDRPSAVAFINDFVRRTGTTASIAIATGYVEWTSKSADRSESDTSQLPDSHRKRPCSANRATDDDRRALAKGILRAFTKRACSPPVGDEEIDGLLASSAIWCAESPGEGLERGMQMRDARRASLAELLVPRRERSGRRRAVNAECNRSTMYQLATRLSYFLWSSMPDEELFECAAARPTEDRVVLERASAADVARRQSAGFSRQLRQSMAADCAIWTLSHPIPTIFRIRRCVRRDAAGNRAVFSPSCAKIAAFWSLSMPNISFLNERFGRHYGIDGVSGDEFRRVVFDARTAGSAAAF